MKNKILIVSNMYPSKKYPHYGVFVENTKNILVGNGFECKVVAMKKCDKTYEKLIAYAKLYLGTVFCIIFGGYDHVYAHYASHTALPLLIARAFCRKTTYILNVHGNDVVPETESDKRYIPMVRKLLPICSKIICPSEYFKNVMEKVYKVPSEKLVVYPSGGVDPQVFCVKDKAKCIEKLKLDKKYRYLGYVSRIEENKGWDLFLKAAHELVKENDDLRFIVVGSGSQDNLFAEDVKKYELKKYIIKYDLLPQSEISDIYSALDVFVFPTYRKSESLGLVGLEALSCGTVVVASNAYGPSSYMKNEVNGFTFRKKDADSLTKAIKKALALSDEKRKSIIAEAQRTAQRYSEKNTADILLKIFL